jgi:hypothetical protein
MSTTIFDLHPELFHLICEFLPLVDVKICTLACRLIRNWVMGSQIYQGAECQLLAGHDFNYEVAKLGYLNILKITVRAHTKLVDKKLYLAAISGNHLNIVDWLQSLGIIPKKGVIKQAIIQNRTEILQQIIPPSMIEDRLGNLMQITAKYDNLDALKILVDHYPEPNEAFGWGTSNRYFAHLFSVALRHNSLLVAEHCFTLLWYDTTNKILDISHYRDLYHYVICECNVATYVWLINKFTSHDLIFLDENDIYSALLDGRNFPLMSWLYDNPTETMNDIRRFSLNPWGKKSSIYSNAESLQWLYDRGVSFNVAHYKMLNKNTNNNADQYFSSLTWLYNKVGPDTSVETINRIRYFGNLEWAKWIHHHGFNCDIVMEFFYSYSGYATVCWLCDPSEHGPQNCGSTCPGPIILADEVKKIIIDGYNAGKRWNPNTLDDDFSKLYKLVRSIS